MIFIPQRSEGRGTRKLVPFPSECRERMVNNWNHSFSGNISATDDFRIIDHNNSTWKLVVDEADRLRYPLAFEMQEQQVAIPVPSGTLHDCHCEVFFPQGIRQLLAFGRLGNNHLYRAESECQLVLEPGSHVVADRKSKCENHHSERIFLEPLQHGSRNQQPQQAVEESDYGSLDPFATVDKDHSNGGNRYFKYFSEKNDKVYPDTQVLQEIHEKSSQLQCHMPV